ncbi:unnamed protein product, partial [marine sediment metagenome]
ACEHNHVRRNSRWIAMAELPDGMVGHGGHL